MNYDPLSIEDSKPNAKHVALSQGNKVRIIIIVSVIFSLILGFASGYLASRLLTGDTTGLVDTCIDKSEIPKDILPTGGGQNVYCTQEARLCADGTYVSRQPPNCEFAMCPEGAAPGDIAPSCPPVEQCPLYTRLPPGACEWGEVNETGVDKCGCPNPPRCIVITND